MKKQRKNTKKKINWVEFKAQFLYNVRDFIRLLPYHCLVMGSVFIISFIFGKWIEAILFLVAFFSLRYKFPTTYHSKSIIICMVLTNSIFAFSIMICPPIQMYLFASVLFAYIDCLLLWLIQDRLECKKLVKKLQSKTIWQMTENELVDYCYAKGIRGDMLEFVVMIIIHEMKYEEIGNKLGYAVPTLKDWSKICKQKLSITSWKN